eukprot:CAMPEP_0170481388 /NCGR_PEP_ID=MMETSP0208-20121228/1848_1 /TAXON_ID=197538 /ORGANISM="Strombidium inclinatum, Strain S3" /LENGTH=39 /DNA_ID= /DNA_START= /DNA_END= /DNA_ORIENTATION=
MTDATNEAIASVHGAINELPEARQQAARAAFAAIENALV